MSAGDNLSPAQFRNHVTPTDSLGRPHTGRGVDMGPDVWDTDDHIWGAQIRKTQGVRVSHQETDPGYHVFNAHSPAFYDEDSDSLSRINYGRLAVEHVPGTGHVIHEVNVTPDHQQEGVGRTLYAAATQKLGPIHHSNVKTDEGRAWAAKVGGPQAAGPQVRHHY
jgi:GNAT superfamily N-acetyltransferase